MSTRAIIGVENKDGSITGLWQWNDGEGLKELLNKHFNTIEKVKELISLGVINSIFTEEEADELDKWFEENNFTKEGDYILLHGVKVYQEFRHKGKEPETYENIMYAIGQDINYLYLFDEETNTWSVYT